VVAFRFPRINLDNGHPIDFHVRLYKPSVCEWKGVVHETLMLKTTGKHVDQSKSKNGNDLCQTLEGHPIKHLKRRKDERVKQRKRWSLMDSGGSR